MGSSDGVSSSSISLAAAAAKGARIPGPCDKVYKDECLFSFDSPVILCFVRCFFRRSWKLILLDVNNVQRCFDRPDLLQESEDGLYVCLTTFYGFGRNYVELYSNRTGRSAFLRLKRTKKSVEASEDDGPAAKGAAGPQPPEEGDAAAHSSGVPEKVSRLAIGVPGGFNPDAKKYYYEEQSQIVLVPGFEQFSLGTESSSSLKYVLYRHHHRNYLYLIKGWWGVCVYEGINDTGKKSHVIVLSVQKIHLGEV